MDINLLIQTLNNSPSVKLLKMKNAEFFLAFVASVFDEQMAIGEERLHMLLETRLDNLTEPIMDEDATIETYARESNEAKAKRLVKYWTDRGFFANYQNDDGEIIYEISSHTSKVLDWVASLKKEELYRKDHPSDRAFQASVASYIEFYNTKRPHRTLKNLTPCQMEESCCATVK